MSRRRQKPLRAAVGPSAEKKPWSPKDYRKAARGLFMAEFRGKPSVLSNKTEDSVLRDAKRKPLKTEGHHILPVSIYPEYEFESMNIAVLTRSEHSWAEDNPSEFRKKLWEVAPMVAGWAEGHEHHRGTRRLSYQAIYEKLNGGE